MSTRGRSAVAKGKAQKPTSHGPRSRSTIKGNPVEVDIAIALLERGFPAEEVEVAVQGCSTIQEALKWLKAPEDSKKNPTVVMKTEAKEQSNRAMVIESQNNKRRILRKKSASDAVPPQADSTEETPLNSKVCGDGLLSPDSTAVPSSAEPSSRGSSIRTSSESERTSAASPEHVARPLTSRLAVGLTSERPAVSCCSDGMLALSPEDGSAWWKDAASRWPAIVDGFRAKLEARGGADAFYIEGTGSRSAGSCAAERTPKRQRVAEPQATVAATMQASSGGSSSSSTAPAVAASHTEASSGAAASGSTADKPLTVATPSGKPRRSIPSLTSAMLGSPGTAASALRRNRASTPGSALRENSGEAICTLCCDDIPGQQAVKLNCGHGWYCRSCMGRHAESRMENGNASVTCPECNALIAERFLRKLLSKDVIERLHQRSLEQAVNSAADLWACPTPNCPMRVALDDDEEPRLQCSTCDLESCVKCGAQPYHNKLTCEEHAKRVRMKTLAKGCKKMSSFEARKERERLEGEEKFLKWIKETGSKQCPTCKMTVTKQNLDSQASQYAECHKMMCRNCSTKFCFKCLAILTDTFACSCTRVDHGFVDPKSGKRLNHLKKAAPKKKAGR